MAFAPPRRATARTTDHRKRTEVKGVATGVDNTKNHQKIRTVIETRHRAWLSDKPSNHSNDADQNITKFESTRLTQETSVYEPVTQEDYQPPAQEDIQETEVLQVSDVNCSNLEGAFSYGYPGILKSKKDMNGISDIGRFGRSDERTTASDYKALTSDYMATINKFKISKTSGLTTSGSNAYSAKSKLGAKPEKPLREVSFRQDGVEPMTTAELRRKADELLNQAKASLHRYGRESRPENHFCPLCRRLMSLEGHNPICIIPCGHSVCEPCSRTLKKTCTICDHNIQTTTSNIVLKRIIERFSEEHGLEPKQDSVSAAKASSELSSAAPMRSVQSLTQRLEEIQQNRKSYLSEGKQDDTSYMLPESAKRQDDTSYMPPEPAKKQEDSAYMLGEPVKRHDDSAYLLPEPVKRQDPPPAPMILPPSTTSVQPVEAMIDLSARRSNEAAQSTAIIPKIANINKQLTNLLKPYCGRDEQSKTVTPAKTEVKEKTMFEDFPDYKPTEADLKKWTGELAAVEMRITVMELQARQTTTAISNIDARIAGAKDTLEQLDEREHQLLENLKFTKLQLKETDMERSKIMQQIKNDNAENERCCEQLNLINYTRAGLEAELDKLRLLCNRAS